MNNSVKKAIMKIALLMVPAIFSYADDGSTVDSLSFGRVQRIDWNLTEVKSGCVTVIIDRAKAQKEIYSVSGRSYTRQRRRQRLFRSLHCERK
jgi:hypothetical protein